MASQILMFPKAPSTVPGSVPSPVARHNGLHPVPSCARRDAARREPVSRHRLQLVPSGSGSRESNRPDTQTQAQRIAAQVERELAGRIQREASERHSEPCDEFRMPSATQRRRFSSSVPAQATEVGLRHRLLDALLFFARPA